MDPSAQTGQASNSSAGDNRLRGVWHPPPPLKLQCTEQQWKSWRQLFESYSVLAGFDDLLDERRKATIVTVVGLEALALYNTLPFQQTEDRTNLKKILDFFECHFVGRQNVTFKCF